MIKYSEAINQICEVAIAKRSTLKTEVIYLLKAMGRIAAEDILAPEAMPSFDNSAMDGFAVRSQDTQAASQTQPVEFKVLGSIAAGDYNEPERALLLKNMAFEIMTGAAFPKNFDACIKIEDCKVERDHLGQAQKMTIYEPIETQKHLRPAGGDFVKNARIILKGQKLAAEDLLALAAFGIASVKVYAPLHIALIATGKELVHFEETPKTNQIRNSSQVFLKLALEQLGATTECFHLKEDQPEDFAKLILSPKINSFDLILTTGAVSMGQYDYIPEVLKTLNSKIYFHKVAIRPGKPILFAELQNGPVIFSLPGNPISSVVGLRFFIENYLRSLYSQKLEKPIFARIKKLYEKPRGLKCFLKAKLDLSQTPPEVEILEGQMSSILSSLLKADAWAILEEGSEGAEAKSLIQVYYQHSNTSEALV